MYFKNNRCDIFSLRLKKVRKVRDISQEVLADKCGLHASAISHFETGSRKPCIDNLRKLADGLDVNTDFLLGRSDRMHCVCIIRKK